MRALAVAAVGALLCACPQDVTVGDDCCVADAQAGLDAAPADSGIAAPDGGADVDAGSEAPDVVAPDAEVSPPDGGVSPVSAVRWSEMVLPPNTRELNAVWGRSPEDVYAASGSGAVFHFDGSAWTQVWRTPTNEGIHDIVGDAHNIYVVGDNTAWALDLSSSMSVRSASRFSARYLHAIAPMTSGTAFLVGLEETTAGALARWEGTTIVDVNRPVMVRAVYSILPDGADTYYFGGSYGSIHVYARGAVTAEAVALPPEWDIADRAAMDVRGLARVGDALFAVGHAHLVLRRSATTPAEWQIVYRGAGLTAGEDLRAIAGGYLLPTPAGPVEAYAVGEAPRTGGIVRYDGESWSSVNATDQWVLRDIWRAHADQYIAVGFRRNGFQGVILRGER